MFQDAEDKRIPSATLEALVFTQMAFTAHPQLFHHIPRASVLGDAPRPDPVQAKLAEANDRAPLLSRSHCALVGHEFVADIAVPFVCRLQADATIADEAAIGTQHHCQLKFASWLFL